MTRQQFASGVWSAFKAVPLIIVAAGFAMTVLGWRFTGNADAIAQATTRIGVVESKIVQLERRSEAMLYMTCGMFRKLYPDTPVHPECPK